MASKSKKRLRQVIETYKKFEDPHEFMRELMRLAKDEWDVSELPTDENLKNIMLEIFADFLYLDGRIRGNTVDWIEKVVEGATRKSYNHGATPCVYRSLLIELVDSGLFVHKQVVDSIMQTFPTLNRKSVDTYLSDSKSWKYTHLDDVGLIVTDKVTERLSFDKVSRRPVDIEKYRKRRTQRDAEIAKAQTEAVQQPVETPVVDTVTEKKPVPQQFIVTVTPC